MWTKHLCSWYNISIDKIQRTKYKNQNYYNQGQKIFKTNNKCTSVAPLSPVLRLLIVDVRICEEMFFSEERNKTVVVCSEASCPDCNKKFTLYYVVN